MTRSAYPIAIPALFSACAPAAAPAPDVPAGHQSDEETAVIAAMDRYMTAISANDLEAMAAMQTPEGMTYRARATEGGAMEIVARPNSHWIDPSHDDGRAYRERYWSPTRCGRSSPAPVPSCGLRKAQTSGPAIDGARACFWRGAIRCNIALECLGRCSAGATRRRVDGF